MRNGIARTLVLSAAALCLAACNGLTNNGAGLLESQPGEAGAFASALPGTNAQASVPAPLAVTAPNEPTFLGNDPADDLSTGKKYFRSGNFGMAEHYFRRAVELHPQDAEAWLDLAASYDRLRRFDLADRAYDQATRILGPTVEILNNQGYSYMLRGDYARARKTLGIAQHKDPGNRYVANNLQLLAASATAGKAIE